VRKVLLMASVLLLSIAYGIKGLIQSQKVAEDSRRLVFYLPGYMGDGSYADSLREDERAGRASCQGSVPRDGTLTELSTNAVVEFDICVQRYPTPRRRMLVVCESLGCNSAAYLAAVRASAIGQIAMYGPASYPMGTGINIPGTK
jgi:hypothetical protein